MFFFYVFLFLERRIKDKTLHVFFNSEELSIFVSFFSNENKTKEVKKNENFSLFAQIASILAEIIASS